MASIVNDLNSQFPLSLLVLTPSKKVLETKCAEVYFPSSSGKLGILPNHAELFCTLGTGVVHFSLGNSDGYLMVSEGVAHVFGNKILLLADSAELPEAIDLERAEKALARAQARLGSGANESKLEETDSERATLAEAKAIARIEAASTLLSKGKK
jgi:F-type H+-transporting ATPase subunit epsilon